MSHTIITSTGGIGGAWPVSPNPWDSAPGLSSGWGGQAVHWNGTAGIAGAALRLGGAHVIQRTTDGIHWTGIASPLDGPPGLAVAAYSVDYDATLGLWLVGGAGVAGGPALAVSSDNGLTWTGVSSQFDGHLVSSVAAGGGAFVVVGYGAVYTHAIGYYDGSTVNPVASPLDLFGPPYGVGYVAAVNPSYALVIGKGGGGGHNVVFSTDGGLTWANADDFPVGGTPPYYLAWLSGISLWALCVEGPSIGGAQFFTNSNPTFGISPNWIPGAPPGFLQQGAWSPDLSIAAFASGGAGGAATTTPDASAFTVHPTGLDTEGPGFGVGSCWAHELGIFIIVGWGPTKAQIPLRLLQRNDGLTIGPRRLPATQNTPSSIQRSSRLPAANSYY